MRRTLAALLLAAVLVPAVGRAEGKCADAPFRLADGRAIVTWLLPVPGDATVVQVGPEAFPAVDQTAFRSEVSTFDGGRYAVAAPEPLVTGNPGGLSTELAPTGDLSAMKRFGRQFEMPMEPRAEQIISGYVADGYKMYASTVTHPPIAERERENFSRCSCTVQRAVIVHDGKTERVFLRSTFHSAKADGSSPLEFAPAGGLLVTFARSGLWFPQRFNEMVLEARTLVSLDVLTPFEVSPERVPAPFKASRGASVQFQGRTWQVLHVTADLEAGKPTPADLEFALQAPLARR